jgi:hypothetical protein
LQLFSAQSCIDEYMHPRCRHQGCIPPTSTT